MDIPEKFKKLYYKQGYRIVGKNQHSAVKICRWAKESLRHGRTCFKQKWYGIESHRCLQVTPSLFWCTHSCVFCWRSMSATLGFNMKNLKMDDPEELIDGFIEAQRLLLTGFKGNFKVERKKWEEAQNPTNMAISLAGEPTLYENLSGLIKEAHKRKMSTFLVTNGTMPDRLNNLKENPKHLYISLCAPDKETYKKIHNPLISDGWERLNRSLELMNSFNSKTILRLTLVKDFNMKDPEKYAKLIEKANPDFIEPKGYVWVGESQSRLKMDNMPYHEDVAEFAKEISEVTGYTFKDEFKPSRVCLLTKK